MFSERASSLRGLQLILDAICIACAYGVALTLRAYHADLPLISHLPATEWIPENIARSDYVVLLAVSVAACVLALRSSSLYRATRGGNLVEMGATYLRAVALAAASTAAATFMLKISGVSRIFFAYYFVIAYALLFGKQVLLFKLLSQLRDNGFSRHNALIIGAGKPAAWFANVLLDAKTTGYHLVGTLITKNAAAADNQSAKVLGTLAQLDRVLTDYPVDEVFMVGGASDMAFLAPTAQRLVEKGRVVSLVSPMSSDENSGVRGRVTEFSGVPMVSYGPMPDSEVDASMKRIVDVTVSSIMLVTLSPVMLAVVGAQKLLDPGPALFSQKRLGMNGREFKLYKFRSMRVDAEEALRADPELYRKYVANDFKLPESEDPRVTRLGRFLRKSSLDELPQLWNVIRGEMSLVGPRPIVPAEISNYAPYNDLFLKARPGITGHWQVEGRSNVQYPERAFLDLDYIGKNGVLSDLVIMARTIPAVVARKGAF